MRKCLAKGCERTSAALEERRNKRNQKRVDELLAKLQKAAEGSENLFPIILDSVKANASIGEICKSLSSVFGRYRDRAGR